MQAIWIQKSSTGYIVWTEYSPSYDIPENQGLDKSLDYFLANKQQWSTESWDLGTGTYLGYLADSSEKCKVLCKLNNEGELI